MTDPKIYPKIANHFIKTPGGTIYILCPKCDAKIRSNLFVRRYKCPECKCVFEESPDIELLEGK